MDVEEENSTRFAFGLWGRSSYPSTSSGVCRPSTEPELADGIGSGHRLAGDDTGDERSGEKPKPCRGHTGISPS
jgi:hypothetical protein